MRRRKPLNLRDRTVSVIVSDTTTVVAHLTDLPQHAHRHRSGVNAQRAFGADVIRVFNTCR
jgi:hypothetical protein